MGAPYSFDTQELDVWATAFSARPSSIIITLDIIGETKTQLDTPSFSIGLLDRLCAFPGQSFKVFPQDGYFPSELIGRTRFGKAKYENTVYGISVDSRGFVSLPAVETEGVILLSNPDDGPNGKLPRALFVTRDATLRAELGILPHIFETEYNLHKVLMLISITLQNNPKTDYRITALTRRIAEAVPMPHLLDRLNNRQHYEWVETHKRDAFLCQMMAITLNLVMVYSCKEWLFKFPDVGMVIDHKQYFQIYTHSWLWCINILVASAQLFFWNTRHHYNLLVLTVAFRNVFTVLMQTIYCEWVFSPRTVVYFGSEASRGVLIFTMMCAAFPLKRHHTFYVLLAKHGIMYLPQGHVKASFEKVGGILDVRLADFMFIAFITARGLRPRGSCGPPHPPPRNL